MIDEETITVNIDKASPERLVGMAQKKARI